AERSLVAERDRRRETGEARLPECAGSAARDLAGQLCGGPRVRRSAGALEGALGQQDWRCALIAHQRRARERGEPQKRVERPCLTARSRRREFGGWRQGASAGGGGARPGPVAVRNARVLVRRRAGLSGSPSCFVKQPFSGL